MRISRRTKLRFTKEDKIIKFKATGEDKIKN